ncbi:hypothetical protein HPT27_16280 [Permianibacter sp. IMCC34836]|uniref:hypothetical protein n=1 Tax=Permianibacter fluminis TaxID=2738515 RepID=UPI001552AD0E|nr:hypothetical protein [Permianibacter fluminis]NQD38582.1 hypothetical protein [Permianibacter fluminis]
MKYFLKFSVIVSLQFISAVAIANDKDGAHRNLADAIICKGDPAQAVYELVEKGNNFDAGYAAYGFGEGTSYKAVAILKEPLKIGEATTSAVISETENSNFDFGAFTYAQFKGDYKKMVKLLKLQEIIPYTNESLGKFVSNPTGCPNTIALTPLENGEFLLGCGWHNGC